MRRKISNAMLNISLAAMAAGVLFIERRRKTPSFSYGDISRKKVSV